MTDGHRRREEDDGRRMGVGGTLAPLESRDRRRGEILEPGGGEEMGCGFRIIPRWRMEPLSLSSSDWSDRRC